MPTGRILIVTHQPQNQGAKCDIYDCLVTDRDVCAVCMPVSFFVKEHSKDDQKHLSKIKTKKSFSLNIVNFVYKNSSLIYLQVCIKHFKSCISLIMVALCNRADHYIFAL